MGPFNWAKLPLEVAESGRSYSVFLRDHQITHFFKTSAGRASRGRCAAPAVFVNRLSVKWRHLLPFNGSNKYGRIDRQAIRTYVCDIFDLLWLRLECLQRLGVNVPETKVNIKCMYILSAKNTLRSQFFYWGGGISIFQDFSDYLGLDVRFPFLILVGVF